MNITIEQVQDIKAKAEQRRRAVERAKGNKEQLMKNLKRDFDCDTLEEAQEKLARMIEEGQALAAKIDKLKSRVVALWEQVVNPQQDSEE